MDRARARAAVAGGVVAVAAAAAAAAAPPPLRAMLWAARDADPVAVFARAPTECVKPPPDRARALSVEIGRAAFRTPVLLGGQAARAGVTCETCHRSGRTNPDFYFPGVSGAPGTADVTSSLFSTHRGDGVDNPKPIPDLSGPKAKLKVSQDREAARLEPFVRGLIVEEFDGPEPPKAVLAGLADYVRGLSPEACPARASEPVTVAMLMSDARRALKAAKATAASDPPTAIVMVASARTRLGLIDERFAAPRLAPLRDALRAEDRRLADLQQALRQHAPDAPRRLAVGLVAEARLAPRLAAQEPASLFNPQRLADAARRRLPGGAS